MKLKLIFDMDGTIADLYGQNDWLECLEKGDSKPYKHAKPLTDMERLGMVCGDLIRNGVEIAIVSWLAKNSTKEFDKATRQAKKDWLKEFGFEATETHMVKYGTPKAKFKGGDLTVLFDDDDKVRGDFEKHDNCIAFNPKEIDICEILENLKATNF